MRIFALTLLATLLIGCPSKDTGRHAPPPTPAASAVPAPVPSPPPSPTQFAYDAPRGWVKKAPLTDTALLLTRDADDAVIIMNLPKPSAGLVTDECRRLMDEWAVDRRNRFSQVYAIDDRTCSFDLRASDDGMGPRAGMLTIRQFEGSSVTVQCFWPPRTRTASRRACESFIATIRPEHQ